MSTKLKEEFLKLLEEDREFRYTVAGLIGLGEILEAIRDLQGQVLENIAATRKLQGQMAALQEQVAENTKAIRSLQKQVVGLQKQVAENTEAIRVLQGQMAVFQRQMTNLQEQVAENTKAIRALQEQVLEHSKAIRELQEQVRSLQEQVMENSRATRALQEQMVEHSKRIEGLTRTVQALGARWGFIAEDAFREGMRGIIEEFFGGRVERWIYRDEEGFVFGHPSVVEVDVVVRDREHVLVEVKSSLSRADIYELWRKGRLYERVKGVKPRLVAVSPYVDERGRREAERLGIEVYTSTMEPYPSAAL
ncbi:DUF3782 domain-containing protein [Candidatus Bathyarchaeota archaeon]|nr:DUF3782 domain-containing protein [Candidatus Bathyarchaeota archaeon]